MTRMNSTTSVAVAADYADAMLTARRAKNWLFVLLLFMLLLQIGLFFFAKFGPTGWEKPITKDTSVAVDPPTTQSTTAPATQEVGGPAGSAPEGSKLNVLKYVVGLIVFFAPVLSIVLSFVLLLIVLIMLVGRLIGVSYVTSAFIWCLLLALLVFPWQAFLEPAVFKIPGVIYTWDDLLQTPLLHQTPDTPSGVLFLQWARFVGFPIAALLILLAVQIKSSRGLKLALGETEVEIPVSGTTPTV